MTTTVTNDYILLLVRLCGSVCLGRSSLLLPQPVSGSLLVALESALCFAFSAPVIVIYKLQTCVVVVVVLVFVLAVGCRDHRSYSEMCYAQGLHRSSQKKQKNGWWDMETGSAYSCHSSSCCVALFFVSFSEKSGIFRCLVCLLTYYCFGN